MTPPPSDTPTNEQQDSTAPSLGKAIHLGMVWNFIGFIGSQASGFVIFILLAMKLPPEIFGVVALAAVAADIISMDGRFACMDAVMQADDFSKKTLNTSFLAFFLVALPFSIGMVLLGIFVGKIEGYELVGEFLPIFGVMVLAVPWLAIMDAIIMRNLGFKQMTQRSILGTIAGGIVGIAVVFSPYMIWALVAQRLVTLAVVILFEFRYTRWFPGRDVDWSATIPFLKRFFPLLAISSLNQAAPRITMVVFGARYDTATVGLLRAANRIGDTLQGPLVSPMMGLWFPLMTKVRGDRAGEANIYTNIIWTASLLSLPAFAGLALISQDVATVLLPESYSGVGPILRAIAIISLPIPLAWFNAIAMTALDMNKTSLTYTIVTVTITVGVLLAIPDVTPATAIIVMSVPSWFIAIYGNILIHRRIGLDHAHHYFGMAPAILATLAMVGVVSMLYMLGSDWPAIVRLTSSASAGALVYAGWLFVFHRNWLMERISLIRGRA